MNRAMNTARGIVAESALIYGTLAGATGLIPGITLSAAKPTPGLQVLSAQATRGRDVYVSEGCAYCHSQVVRPLQQDMVFGRPSVAGDYAYATPELLSDHRNGPDLTNIGNRQPSATWQYIHLWDPRALVSQSIMPRYTWLFTVQPHAGAGDVVVAVPPGFGPPSGVVIATQQARDLVAYLAALKQVPLGARK
jgi:cytochrome c oxidase cbb3-type subunit 2